MRLMSPRLYLSFAEMQRYSFSSYGSIRDRRCRRTEQTNPGTYYILIFSERDGIRCRLILGLISSSSENHRWNTLLLARPSVRKFRRSSLRSIEENWCVFQLTMGFVQPPFRVQSLSDPCDGSFFIARKRLRWESHEN